MGLFNLFGKGSFSHGVHPPTNKAITSEKKIRRLPFPDHLVLPLNQHIGKPSKSIVRKGQEVVRGQLIAEADGFVSVPIHAPATGRVKDVRLMPTARGEQSMAIVLDVYEGDTQSVQWRQEYDLDSMDAAQLRQAIQDMGMVGMGGAAFPSHAKVTIPEDKTVDTLVINGCECEPYLSCDHRTMLEYPGDLMRGIGYVMRAAGLKKAVIGIEDNKLDAVEKLRGLIPEDLNITVEAVETKYPQGSEKMLIKSLLDREVPAGKIPLDIGAVVNNVGTVASIGRLLPKGEGMTERVVTVTGPGIEKPGNYIIPLGTPIGFVLQQVGYAGGRNNFVLGGPMMGPSVSDLETPITKGSSGLLILNEQEVLKETRRIWPCIKCGQCLNACPMHLNPSQLGQLAAKREFAAMAEDYHLNDCFECGCCSYVCPSNIPLVQHFRVAKAYNREQVALKNE
jgi:electron transport complex protein RnfC